MTWAADVCLSWSLFAPLKEERANKDQLGRHQLTTTPSNKVLNMFRFYYFTPILMLDKEQNQMI